ncbi:RNA polymerase sigma-70 factor (ECF subfamily) [Arcicella aurantiaca]|uniref:RNA polymerase sigma-70 factor (ECF subfamily) n=2 Tax=Arcicella aurantiaca TaxID=591202 RepID=A0A316EDE2_9BACT|nr:RNA polymerase sigma-70 factor (ECF subfamily) [Arcicella aurantiaca]
MNYLSKSDNAIKNIELKPSSDSPPILKEDLMIRKIFEEDTRMGCEILFSKYFSMLCSHATRLVYSREVAEDIVSEIFCHLWKEQIFSQITGSYRAYLFKAVRHRAYNYIRWEMSRQSDVEVFELEIIHPQMNSDDMMEFEELSEKINETINGLPTQCRNIFLLNRFENKKYKDIAEELNISVKAVEAQVSKALSILRKALIEESI